MRVAAFVSGGFVPAAKRGTVSDAVLHVADWYVTLCNLAGADPTDDPPFPPLPVDPSEPTRDIYGNSSYPSVDGIDAWPLLMGPPGAVHNRTLWLSNEVLLVGRYKIVVAQPNPAWMVATSLNNGWKLPNGTWLPSDDAEYGCNAFQQRQHFRPCLFDLASDPREQHNLAAREPQLLRELWRELNATRLTAFHARSPAVLLGPCDRTCAHLHWRKLGGTPTSMAAEAEAGDIGPICGVPGCYGESAVQLE